MRSCRGDGFLGFSRPTPPVRSAIGSSSLACRSPSWARFERRRSPTVPTPGLLTSKLPTFQRSVCRAHRRTIRRFRIECRPGSLVGLGYGPWRRSSKTGKMRSGCRGGRFGTRARPNVESGGFPMAAFQKCDLRQHQSRTWSPLGGRFRSALADIHQFSERQNCGGFTAGFSKAIETLDSGGEKRHGYHQDLAPDGCLPPLAMRLLDACQSAWVFGGMGSWNDMAFDGEVQVEYDRTSKQLFLILNEVIQAAANASCAASG